MAARCSDDARALYRSLHWGKAASRVRAAFGPRACPSEVVELGVLVDIELEGGRIFPPPGWRLDAPVALCADRGKPRRSLWLLARTGLMPGQHMPTGPIVAISYVSDKGDGPHTYMRLSNPFHPIITGRSA